MLGGSGRVLALAAAFAWCGAPAWALPFNVGQQNSNIFADRDGNNAWARQGTFNYDGNGNGDLTDPGDEDGLTFSAGLFRLVQDPGLATELDFIAFCYEYTEFTNLPNVYESQSFTDAGVIAYLDALYSNAYASIFEAPASPSEPTRADKAAAFQFVLWEISVDPVLDPSSGRLELIGAQSGDLLDLATLWMANIASGTWQGDGSYNLELLQSDDSQNFIRASEVPLPAGLPLLLTGLAGLALVRR